MRRRIRLTESQLRGIIEEATRRVIQEAGFKQNPAQMRQKMMQNMQNANGANNQNGGDFGRNMARRFGFNPDEGLSWRNNEIANNGTNKQLQSINAGNPFNAFNRGRMAANQNTATAVQRATGRAMQGF